MTTIVSGNSQPRSQVCSDCDLEYSRSSSASPASITSASAPFQSPSASRALCAKSGERDSSRWEDLEARGDGRAAGRVRAEGGAATGAPDAELVEAPPAAAPGVGRGAADARAGQQVAAPARLTFQDLCSLDRRSQNTTGSMFTASVRAGELRSCGRVQARRTDQLSFAPHRH
eukprot:919033-Prymnesium_polylepis.1